MSIYLNIGDKITLKTMNYLKKVKNVNPSYIEKALLNVFGVDHFVLCLKENKIGQISYQEIAFDKNNNFLYEKESNHSIPPTSYFSMLSENLAILQKSERTEKYGVKNQVEIGNIKINDGDLFCISFSDLIKILSKKENHAHEDYIEKFKELSCLGSKNAYLSFHYEDERKISAMSERKFNKKFRPNPYKDLVINFYCYLRDEKHSCFISTENINKKNVISAMIDNEILKHDSKIKNEDKAAYERNKCDTTFSEACMKFFSNLAECFIGNEYSLKFLKNFHNNENCFINSVELNEFFEEKTSEWINCGDFELKHEFFNVEKVQKEVDRVIQQK